MKHFAMLGPLFVLLAACGRPITGPTPVPVATQEPPKAQTPEPAPEPPPAPPVPAPEPPAPAPAPVPQPKPQPQLTLTAQADGLHWYDPKPLFGNSFVIEIWPDYIWLGEFRIPRQELPEHMGYIAKDGENTLTIQKGQLANSYTWMFNSVHGIGSGTAVVR